jgi:hypothetical protein
VVFSNPPDLAIVLPGFFGTLQLFSTMEKFFNEDVLSILMKETVKDNRIPSDDPDECCSLAESMMEEIHQIMIPDSVATSHASGRHKGSFKRMLLRQIRQAKEMAYLG